MNRLSLKEAVEIEKKSNPDNIYAFRVRPDGVYFIGMGDNGEKKSIVYASSPDVFKIDMNDFVKTKNTEDIGKLVVNNPNWECPLFMYYSDVKRDLIEELYENLSPSYNRDIYHATPEEIKELLALDRGDYIVILKTEESKTVVENNIYDDDSEIYELSFKRFKNNLRRKLKEARIATA